MKKNTLRLLLLLFLLSPVGLRASFIKNYPVTVSQPDGQVLHCFITGDEFYNWMHDADNYTIVRNSQTGFYCYASKVSDSLVCSPYIAGQVNPSAVGIHPGINISTQKILQKRRIMLSDLPKKTTNVVKSAGTINNIVIFIRFAGESEFTDNISTYSNLFVNSSGTSSMKNYFEEVSYNTLHINSTYYPTPGTTVLSYQAPLTRDYYQPYDAVSNPNGYFDQMTTEQDMLADAVNAVKSQIPTGLNIDYNSDGNVDNICFIVSGNVTAWSTLLWPHRWSMFSQTVMINGKQVWDYNLQVRDHLLSSGVGVLSHEMFHTLGAPDLYHYNQDGLSPVGIWDIMENDQEPPQSMGMYMKYRYGNWINSIPVISAPGTYTLNPVTSTTQNCYRINSPNSATEYFIVEYRKKAGVFESSLPGSGLIVYRINTDFDGNGNASYDGITTFDEVYVYRPNGSTYVAGSINDAYFSANVSRKKINNTTNPSGFLTDESNGGIDISNVTTAGNTISFDLNGGPIYPVNAGINNIVSPLSGCNLTANQAITVAVKNFGSSSIGTGLQLGYRINGGSVVTENYTGSAIASGTTVNYTFTALASFTNTGNYSIAAWTIIPSDGNHSNDTIITILTKGNLGYSALNAQNFLGTYTDLASNGTIISTSNYDNANSSPVSIGFPFQMDCSSFTQFILNTNGFIKLGNVPPSSASLFFTGAQNADGGIFNSTDPADINIISGFNHDLMAGTSTPEYRVYTSGTSPNRVCTIQFKNLRDKTTSPVQQFDNISFQIKLYETSNKVEIVYGSWVASANASNFKTSAVGIKGPGNLWGQLIVARKGSTANWGSIAFDNQNYVSTSTLNFGNPPDRPAPETGRTLQFNTDQQPVVTTLAATNINSSDATLNGTVNAMGNQATVTFEYGLTTSYGNSVNATPYMVSGSVATPVSINLSGLIPSTIYHFRVVASNAIGTAYGHDTTFLSINSSNAFKIGETTFDLQSNGSVDDRLVIHPDGTISAAWTFSSWLADNTFPDRGTGYNYFDGNSWDPYPSARLETVRTGWPTLSTTGNNYDMIYSHDGSIGLKQIKGIKGSGVWTISQATNTSPNLTWPRVKISGQKVHLIAVTNPATTYQGLKGALVYFRSPDGGNTWDQQMQILPGITNTSYLGFNGDKYAMDVKGDTIAIVCGDKWSDVFLMKSTNGGTSWTKKMIWQFPIAKYDVSALNSISDINSNGIADTIYTCDGNLDVLIDNSGLIHVFFGRQRVLDNDITASANFTYWMYTDNLLYWNENKAPGSLETIASVYDADYSGTIDYMYTPGKYNNSLTSMPSAGIDKDGHLYVTYSSYVENSSDFNGKGYRNIYYIKSANNGTTWSWPPVNITPDPDYECVFGSLDRNINGYLQMLYQRDPYAGIALNGDHSITNNDIMFLKYSVTDGYISGGDTVCINSNTGLLSLSGYEGSVVKWQKKHNNGAWMDIGNTNVSYSENLASAGIWQYRASLSLNNTLYFSIPVTVFVDVCTDISHYTDHNIKVYPNPAKNNITIENLTLSSVTIISIYNIQGKLLLQQTASQQKTDIDIGMLTKGIYIIRLNNDNDLVVKKFVKE